MVSLMARFWDFRRFVVMDFQWRWSVWRVLGAESFEGRFWEGFKVFLGSGRRVRELETWCFRV